MSRLEHVIRIIVLLLGVGVFDVIAADLGLDATLRQLVALVALLPIYLLWVDRRRRRRVDFEEAQTLLLSTLAIIGALLLLSAWLLARFGSSDPNFESYANAFADQSQLQIAFQAILVAPIFEELVFRGFIDTHLRRIFASEIPAMLISSAIFALMHGTWIHLLPAFLGGLLFAVLFDRTGNLLIPIIAHASYNFGSLLCSSIDVQRVHLLPYLGLIIGVLVLYFNDLRLLYRNSFLDAP